jgi:hypothetical protein
MKKKIVITVLLTLFFITLGLASYEPAPVIEPDGVNFDPNLAPNCYAAYRVYVGDILADRICLAEPDKDDITLTAPLIIIGTRTQIVYTDYIEYKYNWSYEPNESEVGLHYIDVEARDQHDAVSNVTIVIDVIVNHPPVFIGCRS